MFALHEATRQDHRPRIHDWKLAKRVTIYLKGTKLMKVNMRPSENDNASIIIENYIDATTATKKMTGSL